MRSCVCRSFASKPRSAWTTTMAARWMQVDRSQWVQQEGTSVFELNPRFEPRKAVSLEHERKSRMMRKRLSRSVLQLLCRSTLKIVLWNPALLALTQTLAQESPDGKRGRQATLSRSSFWTRFSLDGILASNPAEIVEIWSEKTNWRIESKKDHAAYRCKTKDCRSSKSVLSHDLDLFNKKQSVHYGSSSHPSMSVPIKPAWFLVWIIAQFEIFSSAFASG